MWIIFPSINYIKEKQQQKPPKVALGRELRAKDHLAVTRAVLETDAEIRMSGSGCRVRTNEVKLVRCCWNTEPIADASACFTTVLQLKRLPKNEISEKAFKEMNAWEFR